MTLQKRIWDLIVLAIFVFAATFVSAPWFAFRALKAAAQYEDVQAIGELVDFPAVRRSLTAQLVADAPAAKPEAPSIWRDPMGVFKKAVEPIAPPEPKVDRYLTVTGVRALTQGYAPGQAPPPTSVGGWRGGELTDAVKGPHPSIAYWDPNRVRVAVKRPGAKGKLTIFTFERRALFTWRLVHIRLPVDERQG